MPASPVGTVPQAWPTVLRLALTARPGLALSGLGAVLRGQRVRGWNRLCLAAAEHPDCYRAWTTVAEPGLLRRAGPESPALGLVGAIVFGGDCAATRASLQTALGPEVPIFTEAAPLPARDRPTWLLPIRAGDRVSPALGAVLAAQLRDCDARLVYWDEDRLVDQRRTAPWIKPDWDPLLFAAHDGLSGSCVLRADDLPSTTIEDWPALTLQVASGDRAPRHLPLILTHRKEERRAPARPSSAAPRVSISVVIPTRDRADLLEICLAGLARTRFPGEHEIIIVDNDSREPRTRALFERLETTGRARRIARPGAFNFAALANAGAASARGDLLCLLNNDVDVVSPDWLEQMTVLATRKDVGAVGARLLFPDGTIQHAGVALGIGDAAGHVGKGSDAPPGIFAPWSGETRTVSAVTAACLLVERAKYDSVGGMDEQRFAIDFNDVDLCLRLNARGWQTVYCAPATLVHDESRSRGTSRHGADLVRFQSELEALRTRWATVGAIDPHHSPLFRRQSERCLLAF